jgi:hypothetical protein
LLVRCHDIGTEGTTGMVGGASSGTPPGAGGGKD